MTFHKNGKYPSDFMSVSVESHWKVNLGVLFTPHFHQTQIDKGMEDLSRDFLYKQPPQAPLPQEQIGKKPNPGQAKEASWSFFPAFDSGG